MIFKISVVPFGLCLILSGFDMASPSAIPMWEFLSRSDKVNYLYNMLVMQVTEYCSTSYIPDCNKAMLTYAFSNLARADDEILNQMDPYQRGASNILWESMMKGTPTDATAKAPALSNRFDYYADALESNTGENYLTSASSNNLQVSSDFDYGGGGGPMVVRVLPNGSPVPEDQSRPQPVDEDLEDLKSFKRISFPVPEKSVNPPTRS